VKQGARSALLTGPVVAAIAAIAIVELGVLSLAVFGGDADPCARPGILRSASTDSTCAAKPREVPYAEQLYLAVVDTVYRPKRYASPRAPGGVLLFQRTPVSGVQYLDDSSVLAGLRTSLPSDQADDVIADFRRAAARSSEFDPLYTSRPYYLDSIGMHEMLTASDAAIAKNALAHDLLAGLPNDSLPPVLALSPAGVDKSGDVAMIYAALYDRRARTPDHLEAAAFLLARRDGARWIVLREIPIPLARRP
jgi:hypothetical protein